MFGDGGFAVGDGQRLSAMIDDRMLSGKRRFGMPATFVIARPLS
jgi:hypothetical protein